MQPTKRHLKVCITLGQYTLKKKDTSKQNYAIYVGLIEEVQRVKWEKVENRIDMTHFYVNIFLMEFLFNFKKTKTHNSC